ncbi:DUF1194 domain-containing protein [Aliirhizobium smilacinae]|uniref:DUF1194 domain-containing protein n=2 Tax=Aliirhizobium smilacinae TaxID=1395944 RepID=A0A5C4XJG5_9HYPH|nr:DUF1194 domain-containing protein [Rhizobium smilacinae]
MLKHKYREGLEGNIMSRWGRAAPLALLLSTCGNAAAAPPLCADVALVLAIDGSGSVTDGEYRFQKSAIAAAFRDDAIISAMKDAGTVMLSAIFWGDGEFPTESLDWFVVHGGLGAEDFARALERNERHVYGDTNIGSGLWAALDKLSEPGICARRLVINLSGDGRETMVPKQRIRATLYQARLRTIQMGVTINALAIADEDEDLAAYYAQQVVHGTGGFTMTVKSQADYALAIRQKLKRELSPQFVASVVQHRSTPY